MAPPMHSPQIALTEESAAWQAHNAREAAKWLRHTTAARRSVCMQGHTHSGAGG
jgi:hypothetical protein